MSSIEKNRNLAILAVDRAITEGYDVVTINTFQDRVRLHVDQLRAIQEEARQTHGDNWMTAIMTEHQNVARALSTTPFLPTTIEEDYNDSEANFSVSGATAQAGGGNASAGSFDDIVTIQSGSGTTSSEGAVVSDNARSHRSSATIGSFAIVQPSIASDRRRGHCCRHASVRRSSHVNLPHAYRQLRHPYFNNYCDVVCRCRYVHVWLRSRHSRCVSQR